MAEESQTFLIKYCVILLIINVILYLIWKYPSDQLDFSHPPITFLIQGLFFFLFIFFLGFTWMLYSQSGGYLESSSYGNVRVHTPGTLFGPLLQFGMMIFGIGMIYYIFFKAFGAAIFGVVTLIVGRSLYGLINEDTMKKRLFNGLGIITMIVGICSIIIAIGQFFGIIKI